MDMLKRTLDIVLDILGLPQCDDIHETRIMICDAVKNDRKVKQYIDEIVMLAANIVYGNKDKGTEEQLEQIQSIKNFMTLNPDF